MDCVLPEPSLLGRADYLDGGQGPGAGAGGWRELGVGEPWCDLVMQKMLPPERHGRWKCVTQPANHGFQAQSLLKHSLDGQ